MVMPPEMLQAFDSHAFRRLKPCRRVARGGRRINEHLRPRARRFAGNIEQVLDADNRPIERAESYAGTRPGVGRVGGVAGGLRIDSKADAGTPPFGSAMRARASSSRSRAEPCGATPILGVCASPASPPARATSGHAAAAPPTRVMNSRRFTSRASRACNRKDSTPQYGMKLLHCGISTGLMTATGQTRPSRARSHVHQCPLWLQKRPN
jgi:hypothetical protein